MEIKNKIVYENKMLVGQEKRGKFVLWVFDDGSTIDCTDLRGRKISIECCECRAATTIGMAYAMRSYIDRDYHCKRCNSTGVKNPFYGKRHSEKTKAIISQKHEGRYDGEKNPFYGRKHTDETRALLSEKLTGNLVGEKNPFFGRHHTKDSVDKIKDSNRKRFLSRTPSERTEISERCSKTQARLMNENPVKYREDKRRAAFASAKSQAKYKINRIEMLVQTALEQRGIVGFSYCVILNGMQFDFGSREHRILLEVQGDYWHGNPELFSDSDPHKRKLSDLQKSKILRDIDKAEFCKRCGLKLFVIWESQINKGDFAVLDEINDAIKENSEDHANQ